MVLEELIIFQDLPSRVVSAFHSFIKYLSFPIGQALERQAWTLLSWNLYSVREVIVNQLITLVKCRAQLDSTASVMKAWSWPCQGGQEWRRDAYTVSWSISEDFLGEEGSRWWRLQAQRSCGGNEQRTERRPTSIEHQRLGGGMKWRWKGRQGLEPWEQEVKHQVFWCPGVHSFLVC